MIHTFFLQVINLRVSKWPNWPWRIGLQKYVPPLIEFISVSIFLQLTFIVFDTLITIQVRPASLGNLHWECHRWWVLSHSITPGVFSSLPVADARSMYTSTTRPASLLEGLSTLFNWLQDEVLLLTLFLEQTKNIKHFPSCNLQIYPERMARISMAFEFRDLIPVSR